MQNSREHVKVLPVLSENSCDCRAVMPIRKYLNPSIELWGHEKLEID